MLNLDVKQELKNVRDILKANDMSLNATTKKYYFDIGCDQGLNNFGLELYSYKRLLNTFKNTGIVHTYWVVDSDHAQMRIFGGDLDATKGNYHLNLKVN